MMKHTSKRKPLLVVLMLSCLLLPLVSSVPLSRSLSLRNHRQTSDSGLEGVVGAADQGRNLGEVAARMAIEVNDYPGSGANNRHEPKSPGRA
ncbi:uncharacterized protein LOC133923073 [Phragmites australis]|uniref:uncharacterized protein LOC133923073 n=1 Tax=Phragmites australis TaxID=29695 RepID=UPI002D79C527|nr:uncharacterized protein LOC133923073 [Phragmites australis]